MTIFDNPGSVCPTCFTIRSVDGSCMCIMGDFSSAEPVTVSVPVSDPSRLRLILDEDDTSADEEPLDPFVEAWRRDRFDRHVELIPTLLHAMRAESSGLRAATTDDVKVQSSKGSAPLPFRVDPVDDADLLWVTVVEFVTFIADHFNVDAPLAVGHVWTRDGSPMGFPSGLDAMDAHQLGWRVQRWLERHRERVLGYEHELYDTVYELFRDLRRARAKWLDVKPGRDGSGEFCGVCGTNNLQFTSEDVAGGEVLHEWCVLWR